MLTKLSYTVQYSRNFKNCQKTRSNVECGVFKKYSFKFQIFKIEFAIHPLPQYYLVSNNYTENAIYKTKVCLRNYIGILIHEKCFLAVFIFFKKKIKWKFFKRKEEEEEKNLG